MAAPSPPPLPRSFKRSAPSERKREQPCFSINRQKSNRSAGGDAPSAEDLLRAITPPPLPSLFPRYRERFSILGRRTPVHAAFSLPKHTHTHTQQQTHSSKHTERGEETTHTHSSSRRTTANTQREKERPHTHTHTQHRESSKHTERGGETTHTHTRAHRGRAVAVVPNPFSSPPPPLFVLRPCLPDFFPACFHFPSVEDEKKNFHFLRRIDRFCVWFDLEMNRNLDRLSREGR